MIEASSDALGLPSTIFGNLRKMFGHIRKHSSGLRTNFGKSSEIFRKSPQMYIIKRKLRGRFEIRHLSPRVDKYFTRSLPSLVKYTLEDKFRISVSRISARPCNILYLYIEPE